MIFRVAVFGPVPPPRLGTPRTLPSRVYPLFNFSSYSWLFSLPDEAGTLSFVYDRIAVFAPQSVCVTADIVPFATILFWQFLVGSYSATG